MKTKEENHNNSPAVVIPIVAALIAISMIIFSPGILFGAALNWSLKLKDAAALWCIAVIVSLIVYAALCWACGGIKWGSVAYLALALVLFLAGFIYLVGVAENPETSSLYVTLDRLYPFILGLGQASHEEMHSDEQPSCSPAYAAQPLTTPPPEPAFVPPALSDGMSLAEVRESVGDEGRRKGHLELSTQSIDLYQFTFSDRFTLRCTFVNDNLASWTVEELPL